MVKLEDLKVYLKIDGDEENTQLEALQVAAESYLHNSGCVKNYTNELYTLAIKLLVSNWYENRMVDVIGTHSAKLSFSLDTIITQLKYCQESQI